MMLGLPWLRKHNSIIDWQFAQILSWYSRCATTCISLAMLVLSTSIEGPNAHIPVEIPHEYQKLAEVFSATKATVLPPHRP